MCVCVCTRVCGVDIFKLVSFHVINTPHPHTPIAASAIIICKMSYSACRGVFWSSSPLHHDTSSVEIPAVLTPQCILHKKHTFIIPHSYRHKIGSV